MLSGYQIIIFREWIRRYESKK